MSSTVLESVSLLEDARYQTVKHAVLELIPLTQVKPSGLARVRASRNFLGRYDINHSALFIIIIIMAATFSTTISTGRPTGILGQGHESDEVYGGIPWYPP